MHKLLSERKKRILEFQKIARKREYKYEPTNIPNHVFVQCENCLSALYKKDLEASNYVCQYCHHHFRINAETRIKLIVDEDSFIELFGDITAKNVLKIKNYEEKLNKASKESSLNEAILTGRAKINEIDVAIGVFDSNFMMGSMGSAVGEKITRLIEYAEENKLPLIIFSASGGARMQEGVFSLMQMAKTAGALNFLNQVFISVMTNPTTGGVAASFAALGDINIAEKTSLIGFAGPRVIKQTIKQDLPAGFQTENFQKSIGQIDLVVARKDMRKTLTQILRLHEVTENE